MVIGLGISNFGSSGGGCLSPRSPSGVFATAAMKAAAIKAAMILPMVLIFSLLVFV